ncbi:MAG TPA: hypothetical protein VKK79_01535, partial [Candidatus Lokiarchaeia archaeon]|nr:hypothetical protein [Candidatus Lokiarchaeia archaeon]
CCLLLLARGYCALLAMPVQHFATCAFCLRRATVPHLAAVTRAFRPDWCELEATQSSLTFFFSSSNLYLNNIARF